MVSKKDNGNKAIEKELDAYRCDFLPFANSDTANVLDQDTYSNLPARSSGFIAGVAQSAHLNKVWRQSSLMMAALARYISNTTKADVIDDGNVDNLAEKISSAVKIGGGGVKTFNGRKDDVVLTSDDVTGALGFLPPTPEGTGAKGNWGINVTGSAGGINTPNFQITEENGKLVFKHKGTAVASMDAAGNITTLANVTGFSPTV